MGAATYRISDSAATLTLTDAQFGNLLTGTSLLAAGDTIVVNGAGNTGWVLDNFGGNETLVLSSAGSYFVGMGTSGTTTLLMGGTGNHTIGAGAATETFILDATQNGGSTITDLTAGDMIDIDGANAIAGLTAGQSGAGTFTGAIDTAGEWSYSGSTLTYFAGAALTLTLTGTITTLTMQGNGDTFLVG